MKTKMILKMILLLSAAIVSIALVGCEKHSENKTPAPAPSTQPPVPPAPTNNVSGAAAPNSDPAPMPGNSEKTPADAVSPPPETNAMPNP